MGDFLLEGTDIPPDQGQLEVSLLGPGTAYGETTVVHLGAGSWAIIDSCRSPLTGNPLALDYITALGVNASESVRCVLITHFDDDHIRGVADILRECPNAVFCVPITMRTDEVEALVERQANIRTRVSNGVQEIVEAIEVLKSRHRYKKPRPVMSHSAFYRSSLGNGNLTIMHALSPSDKQVDLGVKRLIDENRAPGPPTRLKIKRNNLSVVTAIQFPSCKILHGGDLEFSRNDDLGWGDVIRTHAQLNIDAPAYKVSHHGSQSGDDDRIWDALLQKNPVAFLAPFRNGNTSLPTAADIKRIREHTQEAYSTSRNQRVKSDPHPSLAVRRQLRTERKVIYRSYSKLGLIRIRGNLYGAPDLTVELTGDACKLDQVRRS